MCPFFATEACKDLLLLRLKALATIARTIALSAGSVRMTSNLAALSADELICKGIAPIKREFWKPVAPRQEAAAVGGSQSSALAERKSKKKAKQVRGGPDDLPLTCTIKAPAVI